ncbi:MAG: hypothetical protein MJZ49_00925 [Bacteroidales bacterium]|nr:hypothetical protein [Bacteroidales bacterium]
MKKSIFVILLVCIYSSMNIYGQSKADIELFGDQVDTATNMVWISASFAYQWPLGSLKETFKSNMNLGADLTYKNKQNWTFSLDFNYLFGAKIRDQRAVVGDNMLTVNGDLIDGNGLKATVYFEGRYWNIGAGVGKIIPFGKWRNSGLWLKLNGGYFEHKIRIHDPDNQIPQLADDYKKGYDQRCNGFCLTQFVGYVFMQKVRVASFYAGFEVSEIWSKSSRNYNLALMGKDETKKFSVLIGPKFGWIVPLFEKRKIQTLYRY